MKKLKKKYQKYLNISFTILLIFFFNKNVLSNDLPIDIIGNNFTDDAVILSLLDELPDGITEIYSNYIIKTLNNSELFENVNVKIINDKYIISVKEYSNINKIYFKNNERLKDDELLKIANEMDVKNVNPVQVNSYISEIKKIYQSFGYNNIKISYNEKQSSDNNISDIYLDIDEGDITKINNIYFNGNEYIDSRVLKDQLKSKTKTLINIFANNNFKNFVFENDVNTLIKYYKNEGFLDISIDNNIEYLGTNKVNLYFNIFEGDQYYLSDIKIVDNQSSLSSEVINNIKLEIEKSNLINNKFSLDKIKDLKNNLTSLIVKEGLDFFEINILQKVENNKVNIIFEIKQIEPLYVQQINIFGNSRTYDEVIRRELNLYEGDSVHSSQIEQIRNKLRSLNLFESVNVIEKQVGDNLLDLEITVEEKQTGTINAGLSVGTLDGFAVVAGISERNFYGTGRSLDFNISTSEDKTDFLLETTDRLNYENDVDIIYKINLREEDFTSSSSYKLNTFSSGVGISYNIIPKLRHKVSLDYVLKDYSITNSSKVSNVINKSSGENVSFLLSNNLYYSTVKSFYLPKNGTIVRFDNFVETPTSSYNGYLKNILTVKNYKKINKNIFSNQTRIGNIISLNNTDILTDDKFSLGGNWLRGFDAFGAGPRDSRTSYIGGNNLIATKFDYSRQIFGSSDFPVFLNIFNDYGVVWENKTTPTNDDSSLRSSAGFGIRYYSPIGPIGFSWGFPIADEEYDIKRMFLFSIGNID